MGWTRIWKDMSWSRGKSRKPFRRKRNPQKGPWNKKSNKSRDGYLGRGLKMIWKTTCWDSPMRIILTDPFRFHYISM